ncbi:uncharacterized protein LOC142774265 [Rhipicephalus microplus]|uniref:uncharacterized protein LOC142774265 n=1 Tax=Rhipicephalus microplus TaxID=6941 RepID=UPI003F6AB110
MSEDIKLWHLMRGVKQEIFAGLLRCPPRNVTEFCTEVTAAEKTLQQRARHYIRDVDVASVLILVIFFVGYLNFLSKSADEEGFFGVPVNASSVLTCGSWSFKSSPFASHSKAASRPTFLGDAAKGASTTKQQSQVKPGSTMSVVPVLATEHWRPSVLIAATPEMVSDTEAVPLEVVPNTKLRRHSYVFAASLTQAEYSDSQKQGSKATVADGSDGGAGACPAGTFDAIHGAELAAFYRSCGKRPSWEPSMVARSCSRISIFDDHKHLAPSAAPTIEPASAEDQCENTSSNKAENAKTVEAVGSMEAMVASILAPEPATLIIPASPASPTSLASPASSASSVSPASPASSVSPASPGNSNCGVTPSVTPFFFRSREVLRHKGETKRQHVKASSARNVRTLNFAAPKVAHKDEAVQASTP